MHANPLPAIIHPRAFVVMPFNMLHTSRLKNTIQATSSANQIEALLADEPVNPVAPLRSDITEHLNQAEVVVVDLSGMNANVTYELGVAKALGKDVLLLKPTGTEIPAGITCDLPCIEFKDLRNPSSQNELSKNLFEFFRNLRARLEPQILSSVKERTLRITEDLSSLMKYPTALVSRQSIWYSGFLSCFALGEDSAFESSEKDYRELLLEEKENSLELARRGCRFVCMISPAAPGKHRTGLSPIVIPRIRTLLAFIQSDDLALEHIDWIVSPFWQKNFLIIGSISCYERFQKGTDRGEALTLRQANQAAIRSSTAMYDFLFDRLAGLMLQAPLPTNRIERREILRAATTTRLRSILQSLEQEG